MKKTILPITFSLLLISCSYFSKEKKDKNVTVNQEKKISKKDTVDVIDIIERNSMPQPIAVGAESREVQSKTIVKYNDANKDTLITTIKTTGIIHPPALGNPPPDKPFAELVTWKIYKVNGDWKSVEINTEPNTNKK